MFQLQLQAPRRDDALVRSARRTLRERGMATVEYAIGVVLVIVIIGAIIMAIEGGWFGELVKELVTALTKAVTKGFGLEIPWLKP